MEPFGLCKATKNNGDDDIKNVILNIVPVTIVAQATGTTYIESEFTPYEDTTNLTISEIKNNDNRQYPFEISILEILVKLSPIFTV